jgi:RNA polymerase sigma-70 factor (ECF subfamily)
MNAANSQTFPGLELDLPVPTTTGLRLPGRRVFARQPAAPRVISPLGNITNSSVEPAAPDLAAEDRALIERAKDGDADAYDELVRRHQERIYATIYHMTSNHEDANDLAQETFIKAWQALKSFKGDSSFFTWVYRIAVNRTINFLKTRRQKSFHLSLNDLDFNAEHDPDLVKFISENTPRREVALAELQEKLNAAMQKLSEEHRLVVTLHDVQGMPHDEIAQIMKCNVGTVRSRLFYARQQLQAHLGDYLKAIR